MTRNQDLILRMITQNLQHWHQFIKRTADAVPEPRNLCFRTKTRRFFHRREMIAVTIQPATEEHVIWYPRLIPMACQYLQHGTLAAERQSTISDYPFPLLYGRPTPPPWRSDIIVFEKLFNAGAPQNRV